MVVSMPGQLRSYPLIFIFENVGLQRNCQIISSDVAGECATFDVTEKATTPTAYSPLDATTKTSSALKHRECIRKNLHFSL